MVSYDDVQYCADHSPGEVQRDVNPTADVTPQARDHEEVVLSEQQARCGFVCRFREIPEDGEEDNDCYEDWYGQHAACIGQREDQGQGRLHGVAENEHPPFVIETVD